MSTAPLITIFVRHSSDCKYKDDETWKRCRCRKHFRWSREGKQYRESAGTRSWEEAEARKRDKEDQLAGRTPQKAPEEQGKALQDAIDLFVADRRATGTGKLQLSRYGTELARFRVFCEGVGVYVVAGINRETLTKYAATWEGIYPAIATRIQVKGRLHTFLRYCYQSEWLSRVLTLPNMTAEEPETMPLTDDEFKRLLKAVHETIIPMRERNRDTVEATADKVHALFRLMRFSGLAVQDALSLERKQLQHDKAKKLYRVVTSRSKTGVPVSVPIPDDVAKELLKVQNGNPRYVFWNGNGGEIRTAVGRWRREYITPVFKAAGLYETSGHMKTHRLRDTFACDLLSKGVPLEEVAKVLGNTVRVCERSYAKWIRGRQDRLDQLVTGTWGK